MNRSIVFSLVLLVPLVASAQVRKCTQPDGKVVYSDSLCTSQAKETAVDTSANSIDHSGLRQQAKKAQAAEVKQAKQAAADQKKERLAREDAERTARTKKASQALMDAATKR